MARPPKITNEEILAAAREIFLAQGMGASTLEIAEKAGISEASIFKRFSTKQDLFLAAMGITEKPDWIKALATQTPTQNLKAELPLICQQALSFYQEVLPRAFMMMGQGKPPRPIPPPPMIRDCPLLAKFLDQAIAQGYLRPCDSMTIARMIIGSISNYVITEHLANTFPARLSELELKPSNPDDFMESLIESLWNGIAPEP